MDLSNSEKNGILYIEDQLEGGWVPHFFVLSGSKMFYTEVHPEENEPEEADEEDQDTAQNKLREVRAAASTRANEKRLCTMFSREFLSTSYILARSGFTADWPEDEKKRKNCLFSTGQL